MRTTALVTGAGRGIGRAIAQALAPHAWVAGLDVEFPDPCPPPHLACRVDVSDAAAVCAVVREIATERGGIDWVIPAAGITRDRVSWKLGPEDWAQVMAVNVTGAFNVVRAALPWLRKSERGRVVFIGSINGIRGKFGQANYAASKAALTGLSRSLALELARDGVTVNVVAPGFIETAMTGALPLEAREKAVRRTPLGRAGKPQDVAAAVRFLCDDTAGFITGCVLPVDGGQLLGEPV